MLKSQNIKQAIGIQVIFISRNKHQKEHSFFKTQPSFSKTVRPFFENCAFLE